MIDKMISDTSYDLLSLSPHNFTVTTSIERNCVCENTVSSEVYNLFINCFLNKDVLVEI